MVYLFLRLSFWNSIKVSDSLFYVEITDNSSMKLFTMLFLVLGLNFYATAMDTSCGALLGAYFKLDLNGRIVLDDSTYSKSEFCDGGRNELNANFRFQIETMEKKIQIKNVFISERSFIEEHDSKTGNIRLAKKAKQIDILTLVKFSVPKTSGSEIKYQVYKISNNKLVGEGIIPLNNK